MIGLNKEPRLRFTDEERADPALEKPIRKTEKATARADKAQANIPKKKVRQTVIDPDTGKKNHKELFFLLDRESHYVFGVDKRSSYVILLNS